MNGSALGFSEPSGPASEEGGAEGMTARRKVESALLPTESMLEANVFAAFILRGKGVRRGEKGRDG